MFKSKTAIYFFFLFTVFQITYSQNDCSSAIIVCGNNNFSGLSATGPGIQELDLGNNDCSSFENNSLWIKVTIETGGTLAFNLIPESRDIQVDFDFFIFGPNASCGNLGHSIRCSTTNPEAAGLRSNITGMNANETDTSEGPGEDGNSFISDIDVLAGETYYIVIDRPVGSSDFALNWTGTASFTAPPVINTITDGNTLEISKCDSDGILDNITAFDLSQNATLAIGSQTGITATFYTSENDVITGTNPISDITNFQNTVNPQKIFIRLTNTANGCFSTAEINLNVTPYQTNTPNNLEKCDLDNDGFVTFNLRDNDAVLTGGNSNLLTTYHPADNSPLILPDNYTNQTAFTNETVWVKIEDTASGCYAYKSFELILNTIPTVTASQLTQCDFQLNPDGLTNFNLTEAIGSITGNNPNYSTEFFAQGSTVALDAIYANIQNPQILTVKVTDNTTQCYTFTTLTLNVTVTPTSTVTLHECDADTTEDGFTTFDLTQTGFDSNGNTVTYFVDSSDALLEQNEVPTNFTNTVANNQRLFARIENANDCIGINIVDLVVDPLPNIDITDTDVFCLNKPNTPVTLDAGIGTQNPSSFTYLWAPGGETTPTIDVLASGTYTVTVTNGNTCSKMRTIIVRDSNLALIETISIVDLSDDNSVTVHVQGNEDEFLYSLDAPNGPFQDNNYFDNVLPGIHTIYITDKDGCGIVSKEVSVLGIPNFFTPNGDGYNDTWKIKGMEKGYYSNSTIYIFNRFGKLMKEMAPSGEGWNGVFNGQFAPASDYWYVMHLEDGRTIKGHFALKR